MEGERKLKDIYNCQYIVSDEMLYPLQEWHNQLIDKRIDEITVADVLRMMRQKELIDLAISKAIDFLKENVFMGELYDGQILEQISELDISLLTPYCDDMKYILRVALEKATIHEWSYDGEKDEFIEIVRSLLSKIN